jgi:hypothetical protein
LKGLSNEVSFRFTRSAVIEIGVIRVIRRVIRVIRVIEPGGLWFLITVLDPRAPKGV